MSDELHSLNAEDENKSLIIIIIITIFIQGNLFNTLSAVINEGPVSKLRYITIK